MLNGSELAKEIIDFMKKIFLIPLLFISVSSFSQLKLYAERRNTNNTVDSFYTRLIPNDSVFDKNGNYAGKTIESLVGQFDPVYPNGFSKFTKGADGVYRNVSLDFMPLNSANNLSDVNITQARTNLQINNVDNTRDVDKPVSNATQSLLDFKQPLLINGITIKTVNNQSLLGSGNVSISGAPTFINLASNFSSTSTTPATVTGWSFSVTSGVTYRITVIADYQTAATTTGGIIGISLSGGAAGSVRGWATGTVVNTAAATELTIPIRATSGAGSTLTTTGVTAINSPHYIGLDITFTCTVSGTFNIVWGTEVNASAAQLNQNSSLIYQALN